MIINRGLIDEETSSRVTFRSVTKKNCIETELL